MGIVQILNQLVDAHSNPWKYHEWGLLVDLFPLSDLRIGCKSDYLRGDFFKGSNEDNPSPRRWRFRAVNLSDENTVPCGQRRLSPTHSRNSARNRYRGPPSRGSSMRFIYRNIRESEPLNLSVVTSVASLQCEVRTLSEGISKNSQAISALTDAVTELTREPKKKGGSKKRKSSCCDCSCHSNTSDVHYGRDSSRRKTNKSKPPGSSDKGTDHAYQPPVDTNFSVEHLPLRRARGTRRGRTSKLIMYSKHVDLKQEHKSNNQINLDGQSQRFHSPAEGMRYYNHLAPIGEDGYVDFVELVNFKVTRIPRRMMLVFTPSEEMDIAGVELVVATYIFSTDILKSEVLVNIPEVRGDRETLMSLVPRGSVVDDELNILVTMLSNVAASFNWFIPTSIVQAALQHRTLSIGNLEAIREVYMQSKVDKAIKIYVPMWYPGHWYLMIIDVPKKKYMYLDSFRGEDQIENRKIEMLDVCYYLESITLGRNWLSSAGTERPRFSEFQFEDVRVPQQTSESMDCGVWVSQWMIREALWAHYHVEAVGPETRMQLATDLVLRSHNPIAKDVVRRAIAHWRTKDKVLLSARRAL
ncbi:hypothetical protein PIB30_035381 [Stylosanthes scabra]|uniref:Ubiquitin-like protease family profile domain-containing protein n=1 Tax=Stylosanthes scabra TaxID=79078 RepID=A0ABU6YDR7_9FABA|nr:hypothetical protein [Stylosanthes scabra]